MERQKLIAKIATEPKEWDFVVIGGGATGLGIALDAALRGFSVVLFEQDDFSKGTSSRSTKLVHGGVRYLAQGDVGLVLEALHERGLLRKNAPHLVKNQSFVIPNYTWWNMLLYTVGLTLYDVLAGKYGFGRSLCIGKKNTLKRLPVVRAEGLKGGVVYHDGQFDDSRLAINLAQSCVDNGGCVLNYCKVIGLHKGAGKISGVRVADQVSGKEYDIKAKVVVNATGVFVDNIMQMDVPTGKHLVRPSQGVHLVLDRSFLQSDDAIMIPKTDDGRVLFAVPWHDKVVVGTTDTLMEHPEIEPVALEKEIDFILRTAGRYMSKPPVRQDVLSVFAGLRPLAAPKEEGKSTKEISRSHKIIISEHKLITIIGGKWTTYRRMAQDTVDKAMEIGMVPRRKCVTEDFRIHGYYENPDRSNHLYVYGSDKGGIEELMKENPAMSRKLHPKYNYSVAEVVWAARQEMAQTVEDVLARRVRVLFLDAQIAMEIAPEVAAIMAEELKLGQEWIDNQVVCFSQVAKNFILS